MRAMNTDIGEMHDTRGIPLLHQDGRAVLNEIHPETFCSKINAVHSIWARPEPGPGPRAALGRSRPGPVRSSS
jgi:hypothetical protein